MSEEPRDHTNDQELAVQYLLTHPVDPEIEAMRFNLTLTPQERFLQMLRALEAMETLKNAAQQSS